ncbi:MAG: PspC domain-containing protein [Chloroflexota bacterium]
MNEGKRLYRSRNDRMISGVAAGLGEYLGIDPTVVRLLFLLGMLAGGSTVPVYIVMMIVVPEEPLSAEDSVVEAEATEEAKE